MKYSRALIASVSFLAMYVLVYYIHITFFRVNVVFYASILDGVLAALMTAGIAVVSGYFSVYCRFEKILVVLLWLVSSYSLAISVPTVIDRSLSFYILEKIAQRGGGIRQDAFEEVFTQEYMKEHHLVDVRLTEQLQSGTITIRNGCVTLTEKGRRIEGFSRYFRQHWLPKQRLLMGKYTDALTDPFRSSEKVTSYECAESGSAK